MLHLRNCQGCLPKQLMEIHLAQQLSNLNLVQVIMFYKLKLIILSTFCKHLNRGEGGPSWMCQKDQDQGPDSQHHGMAVVNHPHPWQGLAWTKIESDFVLLIC